MNFLYVNFQLTKTKIIVNLFSTSILILGLICFFILFTWFKHIFNFL